jgi:hypothetical protein
VSQQVSRGVSLGVPRKIVQYKFKHFKIPQKSPSIPKKIAGTFVQQLAILEQSPSATNFFFILTSLNVFARKLSWGYLKIPPRTNLGKTEIFKSKLALTILHLKLQLM